ncbi:sulfatase-like hydrolase/transferase [Nitrosopumilus sp.]|uniref:sulfatase family protein n=1 Tax=Nitrosopumilus sp. TaxID=2024843 RepID=UPI0026065E2F|nr:sulfatase-like hydrolase/transferase [Nitrosopumilus sp.]
MKPNIFFLLIDSFRADKCYGKNKTSITPNLDFIIKNSAYFSQTIPSAPVTCPSVSSIFTSKYPFESVIETENHFKLNLKISNYADFLREHGYTTYAITPELISYMGLSKVFEENYETYDSSSTLYDGLGEKIIKKLQTNLSEPWFYYVHLLDIHGSATFQLDSEPKKFQNQKFGANQYERMVSAMDVWIGKILKKINLDNTIFVLTADHGSEVGVYTPEIEEYRNNVRQYKKIYFESTHKITSKLPKSFSPIRSMLSKAYSNRKRKQIKQQRHEEAEKIHLQNLGPYKERLMKNSVESTLDVFDERFCVPLIFSGYGISEYKILDQQVRSIDIFPTILEIIGVNSLNDARGRSLYSLIKGDKEDELPVMIESAANSPKSMTANTIGIRTSNYKYFRNRSESTKNVNLYDLKNDPFEENNIANDNQDLVLEMEDHLKKIKNDLDFSFSRELTDDVNEDEDALIEKELKKLGYI